MAGQSRRRTKEPAVEDRSVEWLTPQARNPRKITPARLEQLARNLAADPEMLRARPVIALPDGTVIAGNQRLLAARQLGWESIPTVVVDLDEQRARLWQIRDNETMGSWDDQGLGDLLAELAAAGADLDLTGLDGSMVDGLLRDVARRAAAADPDEAPALPVGEPRSRVGEVYELGPHRLACGDATDAECVASVMAGGKADLLLTDPPYGVDYQLRGRMMRFERGRGQAPARILNDGAGDDGARALVAAALRTATPVLVPAAAFYVFTPPGRTELAFRLALVDAGLELRAALVWLKDSLVLGRQDYHWIHEPILYGWTKGQKHTFLGGRKQTTVLECPRPKRSDEHPTMKPVALLERLITNSCVRGGTVLDVFGGSGSTLIAAAATGRVARMVELDPGYCDVIRARWEAYTSG